MSYPRPRNPRKLLFASLALALTLFIAPAAHAALEMHINPTTGEVSLVSVGSTSFDLYEISAPNALDWDTSDAAWNSLTDQAIPGGWFELAGGTLINETTFGVGSTLNDGESFDLGSPYVGPASVTAGDFTFEYNIVGDIILTPGTVVIESASGVPAPAALPAGLALLAIIATNRRLRKN